MSGTHMDRYGTSILRHCPPDGKLPDEGMPPVDAMRLLAEDLVLDGIPMRNLATFVTTWMEPEAQRLIGENLHRNYIDHAEYPQTAEIEQRCIRMIADLFNAPGETTGTRTQGSSEAIMLGALSLKWKLAWAPQSGGRAGRPAEHDLRRRRAGRLGEVLPLLGCRAAVHPDAPETSRSHTEDVEPHLDENTIGVVAVLGATYNGARRRRSQASPSAAHEVKSTRARHPAPRGRGQRRLRLRRSSPGLVWDFRLARPLHQHLRAQVRPRVPRHGVGRVPGESPAGGSGLLGELPRRDACPRSR